MADTDALTSALRALDEGEQNELLTAYARYSEKIPGLDLATFLGAWRAKRSAEAWEANYVPRRRTGPGRRRNADDFIATPLDAFLGMHCEARRYHLAAHPDEKYTRRELAGHAGVSMASIKAYLATHRLTWPLCPCPKGVCAMTVPLDPDEEPVSVSWGDAKTMREEAERLRWAGFERRLKKLATR